MKSSSDSAEILREATSCSDAELKIEPLPPSIANHLHRCYPEGHFNLASCRGTIAIGMGSNVAKRKRACRLAVAVTACTERMPESLKNNHYFGGLVQHVLQSDVERTNAEDSRLAG